MANTTEVLDLLLTARYVGGPAFNSLGRDIDTLVNSTSNLAKVGAGINLVGTAITAVTVGIASAAVAAVKYSAQFQDEMNRIQAVLGTSLSATGMQELQKQIVQTSDTYGQSVDSIAQGTYALVSALGGMGYNVNDVINNQVIPAFGAFVTASGHGLSGSVDWVNSAKQVVHILGAMHQPISQWGNDLGVLTAAENNSSLSQTNLVTALTKVAPYAQLLGLPFGKTVGLISAEAEAGVYGGLSGTETGAAYRMLFSSPTSAKALASLGLSPGSFLDKSGNVLDPGVMFTLIQSKLANQTPANRIKLASEIFGAVGYRALGPLMQQYAKAQIGIAGGQNNYYNSIMGFISKANLGSMLGVANTQMQSFAQQLARLTTGFHNFLMLIGGPLITALTPVITRLANALDRLNNALMNHSSGPGGLAGGLARAFPGLAAGTVGTIAAGAILGPGMQLGGGWLRDFSIAQDAKYAKSLEELSTWKAQTDLQQSQWMTRIDTRRTELLQRHSDLEAQAQIRRLTTRRVYSQRLSQVYADARSWAPPDALSFAPRSASSLSQAELGKLWSTYQGNADLMRSGSFAQYVQGALNEEARLKTVNSANARAEAIANHKARVNEQVKTTRSRWALSEQRAANRAQALEENHARGLKTFEEQSKHQLSFLQQNANLSKPTLEKSAMETIKSHVGNIGKSIWGFGQALSPYNFIKKAAPEVWKHLEGAGNRFALGVTSHIGGARAGQLFEMPIAFGHGIANLFSPLTDKVTKGFTTALNFGKRIAPNMAHGFASPFRDAFAAGEEAFGGKMNIGQKIGTALKASPVAMFKGIVGGFKDLGGGIMNVVKALPGLVTGFLSFGSALLPIIAIVLLVVGAIVIGVLAFTQYRQQVMGVVAVFRSAFAPVFLFVEGVVLGVLKSIQSAWKSHSKEIDAAMKKLMVAIAAAAPFFQELGFVIGAIIAVIVKVIGYLVTAFIAALPYIINVFTNIFNFLGDLGNIITAVIHGNWGAAWGYAKQALWDAWGVIKNVFMMLWTFISQVFTNLWKDISGPLGSLWNNITTWFSNLGGAIKKVFSDALSGLGTIVHNAVTSIPGGSWLAKKAGIPGFASGGYIANTQLSWVGEHGPELVRLPGGSQVYRHSDSMAMSHALTSGGTTGLLRNLQLHIDKLNVQQSGEENQPKHEQRSPAEEYFFARAIQREREALWERYPNTSREFDHTYRKAYQYYG